MTQLAYSIDPDVAREGSLRDLDPGRYIESAIAGEPIAPGRFVLRNASAPSNKTVLLPASAADITNSFLAGGVSVLDASVERTPNDDALYGQYSAFPMIRKGRIWVVSEDTIAALGGVYVRFQNGTGVLPIGRFSSVTHADKGLLPNARWLTTTSAPGQLALLGIDLP